MKKNSILCLMCLGLLVLFPSCNDFLNKEPLSEITPDNYLLTSADLEAYVNNLYTPILPSHNNLWSYGIFGWDQDTDNQAAKDYNDRFVPGQYKVPYSESSNWNFNHIYSCNYFLSRVLPKYEAGTLQGNVNDVKYYIGEMYFLRAYEYFKRYQKFGDFPIVTKPLEDNMNELIEASKRQPRNEVARFILNNLDSAIFFMGSTTKPTTRISADAAYLVKSRVALFEGTWLKYFKGTAFVPDGPQWPGSTKDYNQGYQYPSGSIEDEINYFLTQATESAKIVSDKYISQLTENTGTVRQSLSEPDNPYMKMFGDVDLSSYSEVLLWREYNSGLGIYNNVAVYTQMGDRGIGLTKGMVDGFLMQNGLPIYASESNYHGDNTISEVREDRDSRLSIFLKEPGQKNILIFNPSGTTYQIDEPYPNILDGSVEKTYTTGYALRKGWSYDQGQCVNGKGYIASIAFRATEALLNYMEASYELEGNLNSDAQRYWAALRARSHVDIDFQKTISNTDMSQEALNDWGAYSVGNIIDPTLYNIRRERRCEMMAEGLRFMDLCRWRAMDQMINTPYHIEGFHLYNTPMEEWYSGKLINDGSDQANVSSPSKSEYLRPYEKNTKSEVYNGYRWAMAHYLSPIMIKQFKLTAADGSTVDDSPLYQNPGWPTTADEGAKF